MHPLELRLCVINLCSVQGTAIWVQRCENSWPVIRVPKHICQRSTGIRLICIPYTPCLDQKPISFSFTAMQQLHVGLAMCAPQEVVNLAAFYEMRLQEGNKAIFHLEAFVAKFMSVYKNYLVACLE